MKVLIAVLVFGFLLFSPSVTRNAILKVMSLINPIPPAVGGVLEITSLVRFFLNVDDESVFLTLPGQGPPTRNSVGCGIEPMNKTTEQEFYDIGMRNFNEQLWTEAYDNFTALWVLFNNVERRQIKHCLTLDDAKAEIAYFIQQSAFKLKRLNESAAICINLLTKHTQLSKSLKERCEKSLEEIELLRTEEIMQEAITDFAVPTPERLANAAAKMNTISEYKHCNDEYNKKAAKELAKKPHAVCRYSNRNRHPLLLLSPVKEEILNVDPVVVVFFHDVTSKADVESLKGLGRERLAGSSKPAVKYTRKSKVAWLESKLFPRLTARLEAITGMATQEPGAESYQLAHYEVAGHYLPHFDFRRSEEDDRIATLLIYLSDVASGGRTVFNQLGLSVTPEAHGALFWYNLHRNESHNNLTRHAVCPVLKGEKWEVNKWYRVRAQFLHKPCALRQDISFTAEDFDMDPQRLKALTKQALRDKFAPVVVPRKELPVNYYLLDKEVLEAIKQQQAEMEPPSY